MALLKTLRRMVTGGGEPGGTYERDLTPAQAYQLISENEGNPDFRVLDVRAPAEYAAGHLAGAMNLDYRSTAFRPGLDRLPRDGTYLVYCRTGGRSAAAAGVMSRLGFTRVHHMPGGIVAWQKAGFPVVGRT